MPANNPIPRIERVPTLDFNNTELYTFQGYISPLVTRITTSTASNMEILPMPAIGLNMTYDHEFRGPSLKCGNATGTRLKNMTDIWNATERMISGTAAGQLQYLAYTLSEDISGSAYSTNATDFVRQCVMEGDHGRCDAGYYFSPVISAKMSEDSTVCFMYDTTFSVRFSAFGSTQVITNYTFDHHEKSDHSSWRALSRAIPTILNGAIGVSMSGPVGQQADNGQSSLVTIRTRIMETALIGLVSTAFNGQWGNQIKDIDPEDKLLARNRTLAQMIEELSRNQTLSLFSSDRLW